ncbi:MAG: hypothetical protein JNM27_19955 [Leptospirales bacterium]|nr:hypothetical protein [Leptospirales bacterium]
MKTTLYLLFLPTTLALNCIAQPIASTSSHFPGDVSDSIVIVLAHAGRTELNGSSERLLTPAEQAALRADNLPNILASQLTQRGVPSQALSENGTIPFPNNTSDSATKASFQELGTLAQKSEERDHLYYMSQSYPATASLGRDRSARTVMVLIALYKDYSPGCISLQFLAALPAAMVGGRTVYIKQLLVRGVLVDSESGKPLWSGNGFVINTFDNGKAIDRLLLSVPKKAASTTQNSR